MSLLSRFGKERAPSAQDADEPVRVAELKSVPAGAEWQALYGRGAEAAQLVPAFVWDFVASCEDFCAMREHLDTFAAYHALEASQLREIGEWLPRLREMGAFVSVSEMRAKILENGSRRGSARIGAIGFPTGNRPEMLCHCVSGFIENVQAHGRDADFVVADNSTPEVRVKGEAMLRELGREHGARIFLAGETEKRAFAERLCAETGCDPAIVEFALFDPLGGGFACGANRNTLLLHEAGNAFSSVDDDMVCDIAAVPEMRDGLTFFSTRDVLERSFYEDRTGARSDAGFGKHDYLAIHEELLGKSVADCVAEGRGIEFKSGNDELLRRLRSRDARILTSFTGHIGDPGVPTSYFHLTLRDESLARLTQSETFYRKVLRSRSVRAVAAGRSIGDATLSPGLAMGIDARELLPPFIPVFHAEDAVFGATIWQCCADSLAAHMPFALAHEPDSSRKPTVAPGDLNRENRVTLWEFTQLLRALIFQFEPPLGEKSTAVGLRALGRRLREIGTAPFDDFAEEIRALTLQHESDKIAYLEYRLRETEDAPDFWRRDIEAYIEHTREALEFEDFDIPLDLKKRGSSHAARELMQRLILEFGRLLEAWPDLFEAAKKLRAQGFRIGKQLV